MASTSTYPIVTPKVEDLIVGTQTYTEEDPVLDNPTSNFTIESLVSLVESSIEGAGVQSLNSLAGNLNVVAGNAGINVTTNGSNEIVITNAGTGVNEIIAGAGISISPSNGKGNVTISAPTAPQWLTSDAVVTNGVVNYVSNLLIPTGSTSIGDYAFLNMNIDAIDFNNQAITNIEASAFAINKLKGTLTLPSTLLTIGDYAFQDAASTQTNKIELVEFGNQLTTIGVRAFWRNAITSLSIPSSVTAIGSSAFTQQEDSLGARTLASLTFESRTTALTLGSSAFSYNAITSVSIPANTITAYGALERNTSMSSVTIGDNSTIGQNSFYDNYNISSLTIGNNVNFSGADAFSINTFSLPVDLLTSVNLPSTTTFLGGAATFRNRQNLTTFTVANGANSFWPQTINSGVVPNSMFYNCGLTEVSIDSNVTVGAAAFRDNLLTSISIGENVTLNSYAFYSNSTAVISTLTIPGTTIFPANSNSQFSNLYITNLIIEEGIAEIPNNFLSNSFDGGATNVTFPSSVVLIGSFAFYNNNISGTLTFASVITIGARAFENNPGITTVNVPIGSSIVTSGTLASFDAGVTINYV